MNIDNPKNEDLLNLTLGEDIETYSYKSYKDYSSMSRVKRKTGKTHKLAKFAKLELNLDNLEYAINPISEKNHTGNYSMTKTMNSTGQLPIEVNDKIENDPNKPEEKNIDHFPEDHKIKLQNKEEGAANKEENSNLLNRKINKEDLTVVLNKWSHIGKIENYLSYICSNYSQLNISKERNNLLEIFSYLKTVKLSNPLKYLRVSQSEL